MPTPINDVIDQIAETWVATTPPDRTTQPYYHASFEVEDPHAQSAGRSFWFEVPARGVPLRETDDGVVVPYTLTARMVLDADGRTVAQARAALLNEASLLMRAVDQVPEVAWPAGTATPCITRGVTFESAGEGSTAMLAVFEFSIEVAET